MKKLMRDDTEHGKEYYLVSEVDALLAKQEHGEPVGYISKGSAERLTTKKQTHEQVKNALELALGVFREPYCDAPLDDVIKACEEALASLTCEMGEICLQCPDAQPAPVQEPVEWLKEDWTGGHLNYKIVYEGDFAAFPVYRNPPAAPVQPAKQEQGEPVAHYEAGPDDCPQRRLEDRSLALAAAVRYVKNNTPKLVSDEICNALNHIPDAKKMVQGEPVAWYDDIHQDFSRVQRIGWKPLVFGDTTPQQRKPLTDEEIWKFWWNKPEVQEGEDDSLKAQFVAACRRAIEAARGIKE